MGERECPKKGFIRLHDMEGFHVGTKSTVCKLWRCEACQRKLLNLFKMRIRHGCLTVRPWYFITVTFRMGFQLQRSAPSAMEDLTRLFRIAKKRWPQIMYVKVPELTKKGQIHFHLMIGNVGEPVDCCGTKFKGKHTHRFTALWAKKECACLEHVFAGWWLDITGDSYRVQVDKVYKPSGAGNYLSKYFMKDFTAERDTMSALGFTNRYSFSRNFPRMERMRMQGTDDDNWGRVDRISMPTNRRHRKWLQREVAETDVSEDPLLAQVGEEYMLEEMRRAKYKKFITMVGGQV